MVVRARRRQQACLRYLLSILACLCLSILWTIALGSTHVPFRKAGARASALTPKPRATEAQWLKRNAVINKKASKGNADILFLGDSITQGFETSATWKRMYAPRHALNAGISSDRVEHMLWRVRHGNIGKTQPKAVVILGGVNNLAVARPEQIAECIGKIIAEVKARSPQSKILLLGVFPTGAAADHPRRAKVRRLNALLARFDGQMDVSYLDIGDRFIEKDGTISKDIMFDQLHLTSKGYRIWAAAMERPLARLLTAH